jgi:hypothetical protein
MTNKHTLQPKREVCARFFHTLLATYEILSNKWQVINCSLFASRFNVVNGLNSHSSGCSRIIDDISASANINNGVSLRRRGLALARRLISNEIESARRGKV